jgi:hypothetical protein
MGIHQADGEEEKRRNCRGTDGVGWGIVERIRTISIASPPWSS